MSAAVPAFPQTRPEGQPTGVQGVQELKQQRAAAAREAVEIADRIAETGYGHALFVRERVATRRRLVESSRDLLEPVEMAELLENQIQQLIDFEKACEEKGKGVLGASQLDCLEIRYARLGFELEMARVSGGEDKGEPLSALALQRAQVARQAYELQQKQGRSDRSAIQMLVLWSRRWMEAQLDLGRDQEETLKALEDYLQRSKALEAIFQKRKDTDAYANNLAAVEAQRLEAEALIARIKGQPERFRERSDKRVQDLHLVQKALALTAQSPDFGQFVEARTRCFAAEAELLRLTGQTALLPSRTLAYMRDMHEWEERARTQARKRRDDKLELDLATARYARLSAELALQQASGR